MRQIEDISRSTGGQAYAVHKAEDVERVFEGVSADLNHTYLVTYRPPAAGSSEWRAVQLSVKAHPEYKVRAREGYLPE